MNLFNYLKENFIQAQQKTGQSWDRLLDKGFVIPYDDSVEINGLDLTDGSKIYLFGRNIYNFSALTTAHPETSNYVPNGGPSSSFPTNFEQKLNVTKTGNLKLSSFPEGVNIDEGASIVVVPA